VKRIVILLPALLAAVFSVTQGFAAINLPRPLGPIHQNNEKIQYQMRFKEGEKYYLRVVTEQKISQTVSGQEQNIEQTIGLGYDLDVKNVEPNGNAWVSYTYRWVKLIQKGAGGRVVYDSSEKGLPVPLMAQGFAALLEESFSLKTTPQGRVEAVEGLQTLRSNVGKKLPEGPMKEAMMMGLKQFINEEGVKEMTESSMAIYPEKPVGIGDSWRKTVDLTQGAAMTIENEWILKDRKNGISFIEVKSSIKSNPKAVPMGMGSTKVSYDISGKQQGLIELEELTGRLIRSKTNQEISGQMKVEITGQQPQPPIPVKIDGIVTCEMTKRKDAKTILDANEVVVADPNDPKAIKDRIKAFEGLEEALANVEQQSEKEITEWINGLEGITPDIVMAVYEQVGAEFDFVKKQAIDESAEKTTAVIDGILLARKERFDKIVEKMQEDMLRRQQRESRRTGRPTRGGRGRTGAIDRTSPIDRTDTRDREYNRGRYPDIMRQNGRRRSPEDVTNRQLLPQLTIKLPFTDPNKVKAKIKTFEGLEKELTTVDRMGIREMRGWTRSQAETSPILATAAYEQVAAELNFTRKLAITEAAAKTTVAIDGLLVTRQERLDRLTKKMIEEKRKLRSTERERRPGRIGTRR